MQSGKIARHNPIEHPQQRNGCRWAHIISTRKADRAIDGLCMPCRASNTRCAGPNASDRPSETTVGFVQSPESRPRKMRLGLVGAPGADSSSFWVAAFSGVGTPDVLTPGLRFAGLGNAWVRGLGPGTPVKLKQV